MFGIPRPDVCLKPGIVNSSKQFNTLFRGLLSSPCYKKINFRQRTRPKMLRYVSGYALALELTINISVDRGDVHIQVASDELPQKGVFPGEKWVSYS